MLTIDNVRMAQEIVKTLDIPYNYGRMADGDIYQDGLIESQLSKEWGAYKVDWGISKAVIIFDELPFVIKIPFYGMWESEEEYNPETDEYEWKEDFFEEYRYAGENGGSDYCGAEEAVIMAMEEEGFGELAPEMECIGTYGDHSFYIQEKVQPFDYSDIKGTEESLKKARSMKGRYYCGEFEWRAVVIDNYGEKFWIRFIDWAKGRNLAFLGDMHSGNIGYRFDGTPVILDLAGFNS